MSPEYTIESDIKVSLEYTVLSVILLGPSYRGRYNNEYCI
jgi:hypothetical protein